jgi:hypothetical protein
MIEDKPLTYDIVSYCSSDYKDAYEFIVPTWLKNTKAKNIVIYTDSDFQPLDPRVEIRKDFLPSNDWLVGTGRRIDALQKYLDSKPTADYFVFFDIDCYVVRPFEELFDIMERHFDITLTRLAGRNEHSGGTATAGVFFAKNNENVRKFASDWKIVADRYKLEGKGIVKHKVSFAQYSFTYLVTAAFDLRKSYTVYIASERVYNFETNNDNEWGDGITKYNPSVIHLKGRGWRNQTIMGQVFKALKITVPAIHRTPEKKRGIIV